MKKYENIINESFNNIFKNGSAGFEQNMFQIDFILKNYDIIPDAVEIGRVSESNYSGEYPVIYEGEKISESIKRHNCKNDIKYILVHNWGYKQWAHQPEKHWKYCVVYIAGEDF